MKTKIILFASAILMAMNLQAQAPEKFNYQGIARDNAGVPLANQALGLKISILDGTTAEYVETHTTTTNDFGLYQIAIGDGTPTSGTMAGVDWSSGSKSIKVEIDPSGGTSYTDLGTTELLSVPYALYSAGAPGGSAWTQSGSNVSYSNGNVGVGTTTPTASLEIKKNSTLGLPQIRLREDDDDYARINFHNTNPGGWALAGYADTAPETSLFNVYYDDGTSGGNILSISGQGKVGVNYSPTSTSNMTGTLSVKSDFAVPNLSLIADDGDKWDFYVENGTDEMSLLFNGDIMGQFDNVSGAYTTFSDRRLKENIVPIASVLEKVNNIKVVGYSYKKDETHQLQIGYIAQNLEKQFPEFVNAPNKENERKDYYTVNYAGMSAVAIKAIQEQQEIIDAQQATIEKILNRLEKLEQK